MNGTNVWRLVAAGTTTLALCNCAAPAHTALVRDVIADPDAYVASLDTISPAAAAKLPKGESPVAFRRMDLQYNVLEVRTASNGVVTSRPNLSVRKIFTPGTAPGTVRVTDIWSLNDIPFRYNVRVSYRNLIALKYQTVFANRLNAEPSSEVKTIDRLDTIANAGVEPARGVYTYGATDQAGAAKSGQYSCTFGSVRSARQLHPELEGDYVELSCVSFGINGQITNRDKYAYLQSYGVCLPLESRDSEAQSMFKLHSVRVEGGPAPTNQPSA